MTVRQGKVWGTTELLEANSSLEFHRIEFKRNVCCSQHQHQTKYNGFFVESGRMMIKVWPDFDDLHTYDTTFLSNGDFMKVEPGLYHQFIGVEDGVAFELYWSELHTNDIQRRTVGHRIEEDSVDQMESTPENNLNHHIHAAECSILGYRYSDSDDDTNDTIKTP